MTTASIVVYNSPVAQLVKAVNCVKRARVEKIFIIFNGPANLTALYSGIPGTIFERVPNNGFGAGHNVAIHKAIAMGSDYHLVLNADVWWEGDVLSPLIDLLDHDPSIALIAPEIRYPDGSLQYTCRRLPDPFISFARRFLPDFCSRKQNDRYLLKHLDHTRPINAPYILGCFMLLRLAAVKEAGAFDERFFMYPEDIDLTRRLHARWKTIYDPRASVVHEHQRESHKNLKMLKIHIVNMIRYYNKWGWFSDPIRRQFNRTLR